MSWQRIPALLCLLGTLLAPAVAQASNGALSQLPGKAACLSNDAYNGSPGLCRQAVGIDGVQSLAISPDGNSVYTAAVQSNAVAAFSRDSSSGLLTQVPGSGGCIASSATTGCSTGTALQIPDWVAVSPDGSNVYAGSYTSQAVDAFARDPNTGGLTQLAGTAGCTSSNPSETTCATGRALDGSGEIAISPDGKNAYVAAYASNALDVFSRGTGGALTQLASGNGCLTDTALGTCTQVGDLGGSSAVAVSPDGKFVYVASSGSQTVTIYSRNTSNGILTRLVGTPGCVAQVASGTCAQANGLEGPKSIAISPNGAHVYVSSFTGLQGSPGDTVAIFSRNSSTGVLTQLAGTAGCISGGGADPSCTSVPVLGGDFTVTTSPDGSHVYVTAYQSSAVSIFSADATTGALTGLPGPSQCVSDTGSGGQCAQAIGLNHTHETALTPDGNFAYTVANGSDTVDLFATVAPMTTVPSNSAVPAISGTAAVGQTLSSDAGAWSGTQSGYSYQWQACDANGANCANIGSSSYTLTGVPGGSQYTLTSAEAGHAIRVLVTAYNSAGPAQARSAATVPVVVTPSNTALPAIGGTPKVGGTLTASNGSWNGSPTSFSYQWEDCDTTGKNCTLVAGAIVNTYVLTAADGGHRLRVIVTASNAAGSAGATSGTTITIPGLPPAKTATPTISGNPTLGSPLTASTGSWSNNPTSYAYAWSRCDTKGNNCTMIAAAKASTHILTVADVGHRLRVAVTATNAWGSGIATSTSTPTVTAKAPTALALPAISGTARTGKTLHAKSGSWTGDPKTFRFQWLDCNKAGGGCKAIKGANTNHHQLAAPDIGHRVRVRVTATGIGGSGSSTSKATGRVVRTIDLLGCRTKSKRGKTLTCTIVVSSGTIAVSGHLGVIITRGRVLYATGNGKSRTKGRLQFVIRARHSFNTRKLYNLEAFIRKGGYGIIRDVVTVKVRTR